MAHLEEVSQWAATVAREMPVLSPAQARVLGWWSYGIVYTQSCACHTVAVFLGLVSGQGYHALRQRLREWCYEVEQKRGLSRQALDVTLCFAPLLAWVLRLWRSPQLTLVLDATSLSDRFTVLSLSVVYRGCAIPVAWKVLPATEAHAWRPEWLRLLRRVRPAIPPGQTVLVLADRGLYARWLFQRIVRLGWHPFLRINTAGTFCPVGDKRAVALRTLVPHPGCVWRGRGVAFKAAHCRLACTLVACWEEGATDPWLILTDLPPAACTASWYGVRTWIEQGFKILKRGGWQWQRTRMSDPARAERLWLALAVATLWVISVGDALAHDHPQPILPIPAPLCDRSRPRLTRLFRLGQLGLLAAAVTGRPLPLPAPLSPVALPAPPAFPDPTPSLLSSDTYP